jgi:hypothetical protein
VNEAGANRGDTVKKKKIDMLLVFNIFAFVCLIACLALLLFITTKSNENKVELPGSIPGTLCLEQPINQIPETIPQRKPYDENFHKMTYHYYPTWWEPQLNFSQKLTMPDIAIKNILHNENNLWFITHLEELYRYNIQTHKVKQYRIFDKSIKQLDFYDIFSSKDGTLWTTVSSYNPDNEYSTLARYRPEKDYFELIWDTNGLFKHAERDKSFFSERRIVELSDGNLGVILGRKLYLYDPKTNQASLLYGEGEIVNFLLDEQDQIWFVKQAPDNNLYRINPLTGEINNFGEPPQLNRIFLSESQMEDDLKQITIDKQGRIWVSYFDRLEPDGKGVYHWESLKLPAVMVETYDPSYAYIWANTLSSLVTSDGDIWFTTTEGLVKYDMRSGAWCLSAVTRDNASPALVEDVEGNLWTIDRRQIYKLENQK